LESKKWCEVVKKDITLKGYVVFYKKWHFGGTSTERYVGNPFKKKSKGEADG